MKNQVLSIEQMQELINLGVDTSSASMCWGKWNNVKEYSLFAESKASRESFIQVLIEHNCTDDTQEYAHDTVPTFTLQDILIMFKPLKGQWKLMDYGEGFEFTYFGKCICFSDSNILKAAFEMLKYCKENGYL